MKQATKDAINAFLTAEQLRHQEEYQSKALSQLVSLVPGEDMEEYLAATDHITGLFTATCPVCTPVEDPPGQAVGRPR